MTAISDRYAGLAMHGSMTGNRRRVRATSLDEVWPAYERPLDVAR